MAEFLGQTLAFAALCFVGSVWGVTAPIDSTPVAGLKTKLFIAVWAICAILLIGMLMIRGALKSESEIGYVIVLALGVVMGRRVRDWLISRRRAGM